MASSPSTGCTVIENRISTRKFSSPEEAAVALYETYLRVMRQTGQTNLNLDMINFLVYPSCMNLYAQLKKYTEEVIPTMDQVLKDLMLDLRKTKCGYGGHAGRRGNCGHHGQGIRVRPFEMKALNMCDLNPSGASRILQYMNTW